MGGGSSHAMEWNGMELEGLDSRRLCLPVGFRAIHPHEVNHSPPGPRRIRCPSWLGLRFDWDMRVHTKRIPNFQLFPPAGLWTKNAINQRVFKNCSTLFSSHQFNYYELRWGQKFHISHCNFILTFCIHTRIYVLFGRCIPRLFICRIYTYAYRMKDCCACIPCLFINTYALTMIDLCTD